jgi:hypothetical protein
MGGQLAKVFIEESPNQLGIRPRGFRDFDLHRGALRPTARRSAAGRPSHATYVVRIRRRIA